MNLILQNQTSFFRATKIPVGEDQVQHVHLVEHIVQKFNTVYGKTFPTPGVIVDGKKKKLKIQITNLSKRNV